MQGNPCLNPRKNWASVLGARHTARASKVPSTYTILMMTAVERRTIYGTIHGDVRSNTDLRWKTASTPSIPPSLPPSQRCPKMNPAAPSVRRSVDPPCLTHLTPTTQQSRTRRWRRRARLAWNREAVAAPAGAPLKQQPRPRVDRTCVASPSRHSR